MSEFDNGQAGRGGAHIMYALYAIALFTAFPMFVGVIVAYVLRGGSVAPYRSHFGWGIVTFWVTLLVGIIGFILTFVLIGYAVLGVLWLWTAYRIVRGWLRLVDGREAP